MSVKKEKVVVSGISGRFPECFNIQQFKERILAGDSLITHDPARWPTGKWCRLIENHLKQSAFPRIIQPTIRFWKDASIGRL